MGSDAKSEASALLDWLDGAGRPTIEVKHRIVPMGPAPVSRTLEINRRRAAELASARGSHGARRRAERNAPIGWYSNETCESTSATFE